MAEQWISAALMRRLVPEITGRADHGMALCRRAEAGLIRAKARLLIFEGRKGENAVVPQEFWSSGTTFGLEQSWEAGDFSTGLLGTYQAFGVTFALSGVLELLPIEQRAIVARSLSVAGNPAWITARAAYHFAYDKGGVSVRGGGRAILDHARLGFVTARAVLAQRFDRSKYREASYEDSPAWEEREWDIPLHFWREFTAPKTSHQDWEGGNFIGSGAQGSRKLRLEGVHFLEASLQSLLPAKQASSSPENAPAEGVAKPKAGGRPAQPWWDDMWCAVSGLIIHGHLTPTRQADVEKAMLTWAALNGHEISETAVKPKAKKLFEAFDKEVTNFLKG